MLNIEPSAYGSLLVPALTSKLPTDLRTLFVQKFSDRVWELDELLTLFKNEFEANERSLGSGYNFKEKQDKIGKFSTSSLLSGSGSAKFSCLFCEGNNHSSNRCTKVTDPKIRKRCIFQKSLCYICLSPKHKAANCKSNYLCKKCNGRHNIAIYQKDLHKTPLGNNQQQSIVPNTLVTNSANPSLFQNEQVPVAG